jgi:signal transduction histidine kinase
MITSYASMELAIRATNNGAFNFIPKPFSAQDLKTAVESITKHLFLKRMTRKMKTEARQIRFKFLSVLSHELKSPINAIEGYLRIMKDKQAGNDIRAYEHMIERSLTRIESMRGLIMDMLDLTRIESSSKNRTLEQHDLVEIAKLAIDSFNPMAIQMNVKIIPELPETLSFLSDTTEIEIIFNNLLSNAVKYNRVNGQVFFRMSDMGDQIAIEVEDTGIGMTAEEQFVLFREFSRIRTEKTKYISGSGLGLSIMKRIVELYRGRVHVKSIPDNGTTFIVELSKNGSGSPGKI